MYAQRQEILIDEALDEGSADNPARNRTAGPESALVATLAIALFHF
jgi:hypothetical protein